MSGDAWILAASTLLAGFVKGITGFGGALVMAPLFSLALAPSQTLATVVTINVVTGWQLLAVSWRGMRRNVVLPMAAACVLVTPLGMMAILLLDAIVSRRLIGFAVAAAGLLLLGGWRRTRIEWRGATVLVGALSGLLNGFAGIGGPPAALWLLSGEDDPARDRAGLIVFVAITQVAVATMAAFSGMLDLPALERAFWLAPLHVLGTLAGGHAFGNAPKALVRGLAVGFITFIGLAALSR